MMSLCHRGFMMSETDRLPLYAQVEATLAARISTGELELGERLPSEDELVRDFAVSRTTVRSAVQSLVKRGMVEIRRGRGTFVAQPRIEVVPPSWTVWRLS
ncbi:GntR family transcriptional regulator [Sphingomonas oligoaromativorans]|uniref:GntR family transcriptional regulator n=1 Tax=Sphingomonas oligoaromativorans TaxID=575322 RepID=UPI003C7EB00C